MERRNDSFWRRGTVKIQLVCLLIKLKEQLMEKSVPIYEARSTTTIGLLNEFTQ